MATKATQNGTSPDEMSHEGTGVERPHKWDGAVACAYLRMIGHTQEESAIGVGVTRRTVQRWEASEWWEEACEEARSRWMVNLIQESRSTLFKAIRDGDAGRAVQVLERMDPDFRAPPLELRVGIMRIVAQLPDSEVQRLLGLPEDERRRELLRLSAGADGG